MGTLSVFARNIMVDSIGDTTLYVSAHTADPGATGANEISTASGTPNYARKSMTHGDSASGTAAMDSASPELDIPASTTVTHLGIWDSETTGGSNNWYGSHNVTDEVFSAQGIYRVTDSDISASA